MADDDIVSVRVEDLLPVRSRLSWAAILGGAVVAIATYFVLTLLGGAIGLSVSDNVDGDTLGTGAAIWAIISAILAFFVGGWLTTRCAAGENKTEAAVHGLVMWGTMFVMLFWLAAAGAQTGFSAMMGMADGQSQQGQAQFDQAMANAQQAAQDPAQQEQLSEAATAAAWWTLAGTILTMAAAVGGAYVGAGRTLELFEIRSIESRRAVDSRRVPSPA